MSTVGDETVPNTVSAPSMTLTCRGLCRLNSGSCRLSAVCPSMKLPSEPESIRAKSGNNWSEYLIWIRTVIGGKATGLLLHPASDSFSLFV